MHNISCHPIGFVLATDELEEALGIGVARLVMTVGANILGVIERAIPYSGKERAFADTS